MNERADALAAGFVTEADDLAREFEVRLADSSRLAFRVAYSVVRQHQDAEDIAQEAFARAFTRFRELREREKFRAWLVRMTWNLALDHMRAHKRRTAREDSAWRESRQVCDGEKEVIARERSARLWNAIDRLPEKLRVVTVLAAMEGHGVNDVAALLGLPPGTVKSRLFDARKILQEQLR